MKPIFIKVVMVEGFNRPIDRLINVNHIMQVEPSDFKVGHSTIYLTDGKVLIVCEKFEKLMEILWKNH